MYGNPNKEIFDHLQFIFSSSNKYYSIDKKLDICLYKYPLCVNEINNLRNINDNIKKVCKMCSSIFKIYDINLNFIIMVGLFKANAFVSSFRGKTAFFFLEYMPPRMEVDILLAHETTHLFQFSRQSRNKSYRMTLCDHIFSDGLATYTSEYLFPGFDMSKYLFVNDNFELWMAVANDKMIEIKEDILQNLNTTDNWYFRKYFTGDNSIKNGIPTRVGYLIGYRVVKHLSQRYTLYNMITWNQARINKEVRQTLMEFI